MDIDRHLQPGHTSRISIRFANAFFAPPHLGAQWSSLVVIYEHKLRCGKCNTKRNPRMRGAAPVIPSKQILPGYRERMPL